MCMNGADLDEVDQVCRMVLTARRLDCRLTLQVPEALYGLLELTGLIDTLTGTDGRVQLEVIENAGSS